MSDAAFTPVIIIGAGRSGTNILRDILTSLPDFATWECDEINPIWRHGNINWPNDELSAEHATPKVKAFIQKAFRKIWQQQGQPSYIVEKTCANSLRVPFVDAVLPNAIFIYIVRDGVDVLASASKRWKGDLELPGFTYFLSKARYTPLVDLPRYGMSFLRSRLGLVFGNSQRLAVWGPRFTGMDDNKEASLTELCARQWAACVDMSDAAFEKINSARVIKIQYEDFVTNPHETLGLILDRLIVQVPESVLAEATVNVRTTSVGKGRQAFEDQLPKPILQLMASTMKRHGY